MTTFVLVHGAWHRGACWNSVAPRLEASGASVVAVDLPGLEAGEDRGLASLENWAHFVAETAAACEGPAILVGHSRAGIVVSRAAELRPVAVAGLIYVAAWLAPNGASMLDLTTAHPNDRLQSAFLISEDGASVSIAPSHATALFYGRTPADIAEVAVAAMVAEPLAPLGTPLRLTEARFGSVPRCYVKTLDDVAVPPDVQDAMLRAVPCLSVESIKADHSPFHSNPGDLARALLACAERMAGVGKVEPRSAEGSDPALTYVGLNEAMPSTPSGAASSDSLP